jgi:putative membrane protein
VLVVLIMFLLQNGEPVQVSYLGVVGLVPLAMAMLLSAVAGAVLVGVAGVARVVQLRLRERRVRKSRPS